MLPLSRYSAGSICIQALRLQLSPLGLLLLLRQQLLTLAVRLGLQHAHALITDRMMLLLLLRQQLLT